MPGSWSFPVCFLLPPQQSSRATLSAAC